MPLTNDFKIKNNLNTLGKILSGGVDIATIFSPSNTSWTLSAVNGTFGVAGGDTLSIQGGNGVDVRVATGTDTVRISGIDATTSVKGVASFHTDNFSVTNGEVIIKNGGIANIELATATSSNLANYVVVRGMSGEFSSGSITSSGTVQAATVNATTVDIDGGTVDGVSIGTASPATQLIVDQVEIDSATIGLKSGSSATELRINTSAMGATPIVINGGSAGANAIISSGIAGDLILGTNLNNVANARLTLDDATNGNITFGLNGTGSVVIPRADINAGTIDDTAIGASTASTGRFTQVVVDNITIDGNTISSTNANGNIDLTPNGTGEVNITKVDIDGGRIDGTPIGLTSPASGVFTGVTVTGNVSIDGNLFVSGSATQIDTANLIVSDPIIFLGEGNLADTVDIGFTAAYNHGLTPPRHTGLIRDDVTKKWTLFSNLSTEILSAVQIPLDNPSVQIDTLRANIEGTLTGNVSGTALRANQFTTARIISATGDISYSSGSFDGSANVTGTATINNDAVTTAKILNSNVTYAKIQNVSATDRILGRSSSGAGVIEEITCTAAGRALLDDASASVQRVTLGLGPTNSVTFGEVVVNNGTRSVLNDVYNTTVTSTNVATLATFDTASYNSTKYTVQIKQGTTRRAALEIIATKDNGTWEGTVYGIIDQGNIFTNVEISVTGSTVDLVFTFNGNANYTVTAYAQAISD